MNAVWLSPIYKSPNDDNGYDISNYRDIMDEFGTMADFDEMLEGMHARGIKLIMDLVANHTSDEHEWFVQSRSSKDNPYRDYYIWRKGRGKNGKKPPNNWTSRFGGSAWQYDEKTGEWYLHLFSRKQPDLNWENPAVRKEIADICNFWMDKGVDGFRCDVITYISKEKGLPDGKFNPIMCGDEHFVVGPRYHEFIHELNKNSWSKYDSYTVGESAGITFEKAPDCIAEDREELDTIFGFEHMCTDMYMEVIPHKFKLSRFTKVLSKWQTLPEGCWYTLFLENHDQPRSLGRFTGDFGENRYEAATMLAVAMQLLKGTPFVYQGQEIGMVNCKFRDEDYLDVMARQVFSIARKIPFGKAIARACLAKRARDHARTPMQWNAGENAGFTAGKPWMMLNPSYKTINVENDLKAGDKSVYAFYKRLHAFRRGNEIVGCGDYVQLDPANDKVFGYTRNYGGKTLLVVANFKNKSVRYSLPAELAKGKVLLSNYKDSRLAPVLELRPYEAAVFGIEKA